MKLIYIIIGFIALTLAYIGILIPILPTTPFLLIATYCFARSSTKVEQWFKTTNLYKYHVKDFVKGKGLTKTSKIRIMITITSLFIIASYFMRNTMFGLIVLLVIWFCHLIAFTFYIKTKKEYND